MKTLALPVFLAMRYSEHMAKHKQTVVSELLDVVVAKNQVAGALARVGTPSDPKRRTP